MKCTDFKCSFYNETQNTLDSFLNCSVDFLYQTLDLLSSQSKIKWKKHSVQDS